eukprot:CAMPEP_0197486358 /NCGR_PEP_ID=MMETSP1311-20131121/1276_1 /TAXON_ID=464262 /ORGANISM="Genus nov. species nov., Strain RCC856" /LENGTH=613 /DNA_ID=CAMNT_0043029391 /DNA_START=21 /DNA_END=1862 /DNA_ORIENTATION=-
MGSRVVDKLRQNGVEVSRENENLVCDHFDSLPKRYALAVKDALSEILMHISLLEDSRKADGAIKHCLRAVVANLPVKNPDRSVAAYGAVDADAALAGLNINGGSAKAPCNTNRIVSATPQEFPSTLDTPNGKDSNSRESFDAPESPARICAQDCYELTVALHHNTADLANVYSILAMTGLNIAESHGFATQDGYSIYWFTLQDYDFPSSQQLMALDNFLHANFSLSGQGHPKRQIHGHSQNTGGHGDARHQPQNGHHGPDGARDLAPAAGNGHGNGYDGVAPKSLGGGMKREGSFLNLWRSDLGVVQQSIAEWELDPAQLHLEKKVGQGAMGAIFKGTLRGETVAIKNIKSDFSKEFEHVKEFAQEISIISNLRHENIVHFKGACTKSSNVCIVYEFMSKGNLKEVLQRTKPKPTARRALELALDIVKGMCYLSDQDIVHRDLKAANILISESGTVKIGDFGVARLLPRNEVCMTAETGTYRWMAPEVIEHRPYGSQADVYSFGIVLWEVVTGGKTPYELLSPIQAAVGVAKHGLRPKMPPQVEGTEVAKIMKACWAANPGERPTFPELKAQIEEALSRSEAAKAVEEANGGTSKSSGGRSFTSMLSKMIRST